MSHVPVFTVSQLTREIKDLIEGNFPSVQVVGEVSNCTMAGSGHVYLTLKDESAQMRAVMWRSRASRLKFEIHDGLEVVASGPIEVYEARGSYQLIIEHLIPQGVGALELAFRQLQEKLAAEGLFDPERKRPLPLFPRRIALITSPTSAAVRDLLQVITRRWQTVDIVIMPVPVQGDGAAEEIAKALHTVHQIPNVDVVITGRGGGSLEDLWAFNEEIVARAISECPIPVISAVGHEIDVSISDLVADRRALTPSEAGELVVPLRSEVLRELMQRQNQLTTGLRERARHARLQLEAISSRRVFSRPLERIHDLNARLDELAERILRAGRQRITTSFKDIAAFAASLDALSPLKILQRGYSITELSQTGELVRTVDQLSPGDEIKTRLATGQVISRVESLETKPALPD
jgi:exodeoxyribonuclease VII large subunit